MKAIIKVEISEKSLETIKKVTNAQTKEELEGVIRSVLTKSVGEGNLDNYGFTIDFIDQI